MWLVVLFKSLLVRRCIQWSFKSIKNMKLLLNHVHEFIGKEVSVTNWVDLNQMQVNIFGEVKRWPKKGHNDPTWVKDKKQRLESAAFFA